MSKKILIKNITITFIMVVLATLIGKFFSYLKFPSSNIVIMYILFAMFSGLLTNNLFSGLLYAVLSILSFNIFFVEPIFTLSVSDPLNIITFIVILIVSTITSNLIHNKKVIAEKAVKSANAANTLCELTNQLYNTDTMDDAINISTKKMFEYFNFSKIEIIIKNANRYYSYNCDTKIIEDIDETMFADKKFNHYNNVLKAILKNNNEYELFILSVINDEFELDKGDIQLFYSITDTLKMMMEKFEVDQQSVINEQKIQQEQYRNNLLRSISHDLRTPLTGIIGISEMISDISKNNEVKELAANIQEESTWLYDMVENILSISRLMNDKLIINKTNEVVEEVISSAIASIKKRYPDYPINVHMDNNVIMVAMDPKLIKQVLTNLFDNAIKYSNSDHIDLFVYDYSDKVVFELIDYGKGIDETKIDDIFNPFVSGDNHVIDYNHGMGLGLSICKTIIQAHNGEIVAKNNDKGAVFKFFLPKGD